MKKGFTHTCHAKLELCYTKRGYCHAKQPHRHPEFISGSKDVLPQQQTLKQAASCCVPAPHRHCHIHTGCRVQGDRGAGYAFTLAEVLITLAIIGVVATLTIPAVVKNYKQQELVAKLKKAYSTLANTTNLIISEEGAVKDWNTSTQNIYELYKKHLKVSKDCGPNPGCMPQTPYKYLYNIASSDDWDNQTARYKMVLADGAQFSISDFSASCKKNNPSSIGSNNVCAVFAFDVNGTKPPNEVGRDLFSFVLQENGIKPSGCDIEGLCQKGYPGYACACKVIREGKMDY